MGLDIAFNRMLAVDAGIEFDIIPNSDRTEFDDDEDPEYIAWCKESSECIRVPGMEHWVNNDGVDNEIVVRANKWGRTYAPLTAWLSANNIEWRES